MFVSDDGRRMIQQLQGVDISEGGMGIAGPMEHPVGTQLIINLPKQNGRSEYVHAKIVRCWEENFQFRMGLEFNDSPTDMVMRDSTELRIAA